jgi:hypothetical protein
LLGSLLGVLEKGLVYATERGIDPQLLADARLIDGMFPLHRPAYDILRAQGVPIGKRDCLSRHRTTLR